MQLPKLAFRAISKYLRKKNINIVGSLFFYTNHHRLKNTIHLDYIRTATLELVCNEISKKQLQGSLAEVGVYKGEFASKINALFPDKTLYLFDTFNGFDDRDKKTEKAFSFSSANQNFSNTSIDLVLSKMTNAKNCIVKKGYFPDTASDLNDEFILVSLDADLYEPILAGLNFFYPKLVNGGYIFIHDYNNDEYKGAQRAVEEFCKEHNVAIVPIPDICGTAIITK